MNQLAAIIRSFVYGANEIGSFKQDQATEFSSEVDWIFFFFHLSFACFGNKYVHWQTSLTLSSASEVYKLYWLQ